MCLEKLKKELLRSTWKKVGKVVGALINKKCEMYLWYKCNFKWIVVMPKVTILGMILWQNLLYKINIW